MTQNRELPEGFAVKPKKSGKKENRSINFRQVDEDEECPVSLMIVNIQTIGYSMSKQRE